VYFKDNTQQLSLEITQLPNTSHYLNISISVTRKGLNMITDSKRKSYFFRKDQLLFLPNRSVCTDLVSPPESTKVLWKSGNWESCFGQCWRNHLYVLQLKLLVWSIWLLQLKGRGRKVGKSKEWQGGDGRNKEEASKEGRKEGREREKSKGSWHGSSVLLSTSQCTESLSAGRVMIWIKMHANHGKINVKKSLLQVSQAFKTFFFNP